MNCNTSKQGLWLHQNVLLLRNGCSHIISAREEDTTIKLKAQSMQWLTNTIRLPLTLQEGVCCWRLRLNWRLCWVPLRCPLHLETWWRPSLGYCYMLPTYASLHSLWLLQINICIQRFERWNINTLEKKKLKIDWKYMLRALLLQISSPLDTKLQGFDYIVTALFFFVLKTYDVSSRSDIFELFSI